MFAAGAMRIGAVVPASWILAGAGRVLFAFGGEAMAPASFNAAAGGEEGLRAGAGVEVRVCGGGGGGVVGALVAAMAILGTATEGASAGSWICPSLI